ncbi:hypothetical protein HPB48_012754 [Haemaphysalis longicornis]|uniref:Uncharacterized protein n=1 Tax=Haemaphysalis longicornis TaxID=44386 RepID=A0A9J6GDM6_HAELO|nr:hypothetical protein HPB48_012754 [Haemaphysalis longicornis]
MRMVTAKLPERRPSEQVSEIEAGDPDVTDAAKSIHWRAVRCWRVASERCKLGQQEDHLRCGVVPSRRLDCTGLGVAKARLPPGLHDEEEAVVEAA